MRITYGRNNKLNVGREFSVKASTIDENDFKTVYILFKSWVKPLNEEGVNEINDLKKQVKSKINENIDTKLFDKNFILNFNITQNHFKLNKKSLLTVEITFFTNDGLTFDDQCVQENLWKISKSMADRIRKNKNYEFRSK